MQPVFFQSADDPLHLRPSTQPATYLQIQCRDARHIFLQMLLSYLHSNLNTLDLPDQLSILQFLKVPLSRPFFCTIRAHQSPDCKEEYEASVSDLSLQLFSKLCRSLPSYIFPVQVRRSSSKP